MIFATYQLDSEDYLNHQLFVASKSEIIQKRRRLTRFLWPILYLLIALYFYVNTQKALAVYLFVMSIVWLLFYPKWDQIRYVNHYKKFINNHYKNLPEKAVIEFHSDFIFVSDSDSEGKINWTKFTEIFETEDYFFLRLENAQSLILPKKKLSNWEEIKTFLQSKTAELGIPYTLELDWRWK